MASKKNKPAPASSSAKAGKVDENKVAQTVASSAVAPTAVATRVAPSTPAAPVVAPAAATASVVKTASAVGVTAFAQDRDRTAIVTLIGRLRDPDAEVARDAAATLGTLPADAQAVAALGEVLLNADGYFHSVVRAAAAASLGTLKAPQSVEALIHATGDTMAEASEEAIKALGRLGDRRALPSLESIVRNQNGFFLEHIRRAAQESAARIAGTVAKA